MSNNISMDIEGRVDKLFDDKYNITSEIRDMQNSLRDREEELLRDIVTSGMVKYLSIRKLPRHRHKRSK